MDNIKKAITVRRRPDLVSVDEWPAGGIVEYKLEVSFLYRVSEDKGLDDAARRIKHQLLGNTIASIMYELNTIQAVTHYDPKIQDAIAAIRRALEINPHDR